MEVDLVNSISWEEELPVKAEQISRKIAIVRTNADVDPDLIDGKSRR
jgi:hypothetical protein